MLVYAASQSLEIPADELSAARRRALLVHAAGGDPHRDLTLDARAGEVLAVDLDTPERRARLDDGLAALAEEADGLSVVKGALVRLRADPQLGWRALAVGLLAEELAGDG